MEEALFVGTIASFILSYFIERRLIIVIVTICIMLSTFFVVDQLKRTTFNKVYAKELNEDTLLKRVKMTKAKIVDGTRVGSYQIMIDDEEVIEQMVDILSQLKLKKEKNLCYEGIYRQYRIYFDSAQEIEEGIYHHRRGAPGVSLGENCLSIYTIMNDTNHIEAIESLIEDYEWTDN